MTQNVQTNKEMYQQHIGKRRGAVYFLHENTHCNIHAKVELLTGMSPFLKNSIDVVDVFGQRFLLVFYPEHFRWALNVLMCKINSVLNVTVSVHKCLFNTRNLFQMLLLQMYLIIILKIVDK